MLQIIAAAVFMAWPLEGGNNGVQLHIGLRLATFSTRLKIIQHDTQLEYVSATEALAGCSLVPYITRIYL